VYIDLFLLVQFFTWLIPTWREKEEMNRAKTLTKKNRFYVLLICIDFNANL